MPRMTEKQLQQRLQGRLSGFDPVAGSRARSRVAVVATEKEIQTAILQFLARCSAVAWAKNMTVGRFKVADRAGTRWIQAGFVGCSDIIGQLTDGRLLAIEVKRHDGRATQEQLDFLRTVRAANGIAIIARSVDDVIEAIQNARSHSEIEAIRAGF